MVLILVFKTKVEDYNKASGGCKAYACITTPDCMARESKSYNESIQKSNLHGTVVCISSVYSRVACGHVLAAICSTQSKQGYISYHEEKIDSSKERVTRSRKQNR